MPPKRADRDTAGRAAPAKAARGGKDSDVSYARPFFSRALTKQEIQEDIAAITSTMKRQGRAPARFAQQPAHGEEDMPQGRNFVRGQPPASYSRQAGPHHDSAHHPHVAAAAAVYANHGGLHPQSTYEMAQAQMAANARMAPGNTSLPGLRMPSFPAQLQQLQQQQQQYVMY